MSTRELQHANWVFTFNYGGEGQPPEDAVLRFINDVLPGRCDYFIAGFETAPSTGQKHVQGYLQLKKRDRMSALKKLPDAGTIHWEVAKGDELQNREYCTKSCGEDFIEFGEPKPIHAGRREKERWKKIRQLACAGDLENIDDAAYVQHYNAIRAIARDNMKPSIDESSTTGVWVWGPSGCGKSRWAREVYGKDTNKLFLKPLNKWWDGFRKEAHENVLLEDMDPDHSILGYHLKIWADRYSFPAEIKGSTIQIRPKKIVITSQYPPELIWNDTETLAAVRRRFLVLHKKDLEAQPLPDVPVQPATGTVASVNLPPQPTADAAEHGTERNTWPLATSADTASENSSLNQKTETTRTKSGLEPSQNTSPRELNQPLSNEARQETLPLLVLHRQEAGLVHQNENDA